MFIKDVCKCIAGVLAVLAIGIALSGLFLGNKAHGETYQFVNVHRPDLNSFPEKDRMFVQFHFHKDYQSIEDEYFTLYKEMIHLRSKIRVKGFAESDNATGFSDVCTIHVLADDWEIVIHEIKHCMYGAFHSEYRE